MKIFLNKRKNYWPRGAIDITIIRNFTLCSHEYNTQSDYYTLKRNNTLLVSVLLKYRSHSIFLHRLFSSIVYGIPHFALKMVFLSNLVYFTNEQEYYIYRRIKPCMCHYIAKSRMIANLINLSTTKSFIFNSNYYSFITIACTN